MTGALRPKICECFSVLGGSAPKSLWLARVSSVSASLNYILKCSVRVLCSDWCQFKALGFFCGELRLAKASRMARMNHNYEAMDASPHDQWEEAFYYFEDYAQKEKFPLNSAFSEIVSKIRGVFVLIID